MTAVLALVQAAAVIVYRNVERNRRDAETEFPVETLPPRPAPDVGFQRLDGSTLRLSSLRGRIVLLHFWATWCPPCREELPQLLSFGRSLGGGYRVVAVSLDDDWDRVADFFDGAIPAEVVRDAERKSIGEFEISILPDTYLIDADGGILLRLGGARDWEGPAARRILAGRALREN